MSGAELPIIMGVLGAGGIGMQAIQGGASRSQAEELARQQQALALTQPNSTAVENPLAQNLQPQQGGMIPPNMLLASSSNDPSMNQSIMMQDQSRANVLSNLGQQVTAREAAGAKSNLVSDTSKTTSTAGFKGTDLLGPAATIGVGIMQYIANQSALEENRKKRQQDLAMSLLNQQGGTIQPPRFI